MSTKAKGADSAADADAAAEKDAKDAEKAAEKAAKEREQAEEDFAAAAAVLLEMGRNRSEIAQLVENQHNAMHGENVAAAKAEEETDAPYPALA